jgi:hypothetical protein
MASSRIGTRTGSSPQLHGSRAAYARRSLRRRLLAGGHFRDASRACEIVRTVPRMIADFTAAAWGAPVCGVDVAWRPAGGGSLADSRRSHAPKERRGPFRRRGTVH